MHDIPCIHCFFSHHCEPCRCAVFHDERWNQRKGKDQRHGQGTGFQDWLFSAVVRVHFDCLEDGLHPADGSASWQIDPVKKSDFKKQQRPHDAAFGMLGQSAFYSQYTRMYKPNHTTSTKCQYQAAPSKPKCLSAVKWPFCKRSVMKNSINIPTNT